MTKFNVKDENTHHAGGKKEHKREGDEEEEEVNYGGARKVQCANQ